MLHIAFYQNRNLNRVIFYNNSFIKQKQKEQVNFFLGIASSAEIFVMKISSLKVAIFFYDYYIMSHITLA